MIAVESRRTLCTVILLALMVMPATGCQRTQKSTSSGSAQTSETEDEASITESEQEPDVSPVYPVDIGAPDPLAQRFCDTLHTLPETRKAQCCGDDPILHSCQRMCANPEHSAS